MTKGLSARAGENCVRHWENLGYDVDEVHATGIVGTGSWLVEAVGWKDEAKCLLSAIVEPEDATEPWWTAFLARWQPLKRYLTSIFRTAFTKISLIESRCHL